jgi:elongation factor P--(R)-beta-lysine ligase
MTIERRKVIKPNLILRAKIMAAIRRFFDNHDFLEVQTPVRMPAPAPEAHIDAQPSGRCYLQTSPELYMKRLMAAGYQRIYQVCPCFRRKERGKRHLPELTLLEWYVTPGDYKIMMSQTMALIRYVADWVGSGQKLSYHGNPIDLASPWDRLSVKAAFDRFGSLSMEAALKARRFDEIMGLEIEPNLGIDRPLFLYDYPASAGALARLKEDDPTMVERCELYMAGLELCNAFSELTDAKEQRQRFERELNLRKKAGKNVYPMPENFLKVLDQMPKAGGNALGVDRLVMLFCDTDKIDDVVAFTPEEL